MRRKNYIRIAIDGPVAAGKGTVARALADRLGILYVDTGAMYRVAALLAKRVGIAWSDEEGVAELVGKAKISMHLPEGLEKDGRLVTVLVNGEDVSWKIRTEEMSHGSSAVAVLPKVRAELVKKQKAVAREQSVVMEGRDITTVVLANASLKIYLTATLKERARRRFEQLLARGEKVDYKKVLSDMKARDVLDSDRKVDPLTVADDAWVLDTTDLTVGEVVERIVERIRKMMRS